LLLEIAQANISVDSACNGSLRALIMTAFKAGWNNDFSQAKPHATEEFIESQLGDIREKAAVAHIPRLTPGLISNTLPRVHQVTRSELLGIFRDYPSSGSELTELRSNAGNS
jgi:hypothetical protein